MDKPFSFKKRRKKKHVAKEKYQRNGKYSQKNIRIKISQSENVQSGGTTIRDTLNP
jgi:hypothetical protein